MVCFKDLFGDKKALIGMIHLSGENSRDRINRAIYEMHIFEDGGFDGVIVENYHGVVSDVERFLESSQKIRTNLVKGVNILGDPFYGFELAKKYGADFIQFDSIQPEHIDSKRYNGFRLNYSNVAVFGGVRFKYQQPSGKCLEEDLDNSLPCEAIVTTGKGTGIETPIEKLREFRSILPNSVPIIVGAGVNEQNSAEQSKYTNGAIIGSGVKFQSNTQYDVDALRVKAIRELW